MGFKELKKERANKTLDLLNEIKEIVDKYAERIAQKNIKVLSQETIDWDALVDEYLDIIYDCLEEIYSLTLEGIRNIYDIEPNDVEITIDDINDLTYQDDGLTLEERIKKHFDEYKENRPSKERLLYDLIKILNTESLSVMNNLIKNKLDFEYAAIEDSQCCDICSEHAEQDYVLVEDFEEPPYHPNCECIAVYFTSDEIED